MTTMGHLKLADCAVGARRRLESDTRPRRHEQARKWVAGFGQCTRASLSMLLIGWVCTVWGGRKFAFREHEAWGTHAGISGTSHLCIGPRMGILNTQMLVHN
jgi:hypothetical protein